MKGTEKIIEHIASDAKAQADAILAEAEKQCAGIAADYKVKAEKAYEAKLTAGTKAIEENADGRERIAHMEAKKDILNLKQEMVSKSFSKAMDMIVSMSDKEYLEFLVKLVVKGATGENETVVFNARDKEKFADEVIARANKQLDGNLTVSKETGDFAGGVIIKRGAISVNNTVELLIDLKKSEMSAELANLLFK